MGGGGEIVNRLLWRVLQFLPKSQNPTNEDVEKIAILRQFGVQKCRNPAKRQKELCNRFCKLFSESSTSFFLPCCPVPFCQGKQGELSNIFCQTSMYSSFCHFLEQKEKTRNWMQHSFGHMVRWVAERCPIRATALPISESEITLLNYTCPQWQRLYQIICFLIVRIWEKVWT